MKRRKLDMASVPGKAAVGADERLQVSTPLRKLLNKVFPDHWSFLLGEIALFSFVVLLLTGVFLTFFYEPAMTEVVYNGSYAPCGARRCRPRTPPAWTSRSTSAVA